MIPIEGPKITSAIWGPLEEYIIAGNEGGEICHYDVKVGACAWYLIIYNLFLC